MWLVHGPVRAWIFVGAQPTEPSDFLSGIAVTLLLFGPALGATLVGGMHHQCRRQRVLTNLACGAAAGVVSMLLVEKHSLRLAVFLHPLVLWGMAGEFMIRATLMACTTLLVSWVAARLSRTGPPT